MYAYLNNAFVHSADVRIPVSDRGFRFGDGVFESIAVYQGKPYQWAFHLERLNAGLKALGITFDTAPLADICTELLARNAVVQDTLRIAISRGSGSMGYLPAPDCRATLVIETLPRRDPPPSPVALWHSRYEKISPKSLPVEHKLAQGLQSTLARMEAQAQACTDGLLLTAQGHVAEASSANVFWLKNGTLYTPSLATGALAGSTRHAVLRLSPWPVVEGTYALVDLQQADAVLLTNTSWCVLPVAQLLPQGWEWKSDAAAATLNDLLLKDIAAQCASA